MFSVRVVHVSLGPTDWWASCCLVAFRFGGLNQRRQSADPEWCKDGSGLAGNGRPMDNGRMARSLNDSIGCLFLDRSPLQQRARVIGRSNLELREAEVMDTSVYQCVQNESIIGVALLHVIG